MGTDEPPPDAFVLVLDVEDDEDDGAVLLELLFRLLEEEDVPPVDGRLVFIFPLDDALEVEEER